MGFDWRKHQVCETDPLDGGVAIFPGMQEALLFDGATPVVRFSDLARLRLFPVIKVHHDEPNHFEWEDRNQKRHWLKPLTLVAWQRAELSRVWPNEVFEDLDKLCDRLKKHVRRGVHRG